MGLDLLVEGCARPGHEAEWRRIMERYLADEPLSDAETERFPQISTPAYERLGAPRVGEDPAADAWIIEKLEARTPGEVASVLTEYRGYYALPLVKSDGVPDYTHGGQYDGVDETSFRGSFLSLCTSVLDQALINRAWEHKLPEQAVAYGQELLAAAEAARSAGPRPPPKRGLLGFLGGKGAEPTPLDEQLRIVEAAGRWFVFWGSRGHPIRAWA